MIYDETIAKELIDKFDLSSKTLLVWKTRGKIPDKYFKETYQKPQEASKADLIIQQRIFEVFNLGFLNATVICELAGLKFQKYIDVKRGNVNALSAQEIFALKKEITKIKIQIVKTFEKKSSIELRKLLNNSAIYSKPIIDSGGGDKNDADRVSRFKLNKIEIDSLNYQLIKDCFIKAALQINL